MRQIFVIGFTVALAACAGTTSQSRTNPGGFLVYSFNYQTCNGGEVDIVYPSKVAAPDVKDPNLYGLEAFAEVRVNPPTGDVLSARLVRGSEKLYSSLADYPMKRTLMGANADCFMARYRVMSFMEVMRESNEVVKAKKEKESSAQQ